MDEIKLVSEAEDAKKKKKKVIEARTFAGICKSY
jgi:hypothetical protein